MLAMMKEKRELVTRVRIKRLLMSAQQPW